MQSLQKVWPQGTTRTGSAITREHIPHTKQSWTVSWRMYFCGMDPWSSMSSLISHTHVAPGVAKWVSWQSSALGGKAVLCSRNIHIWTCWRRTNPSVIMGEEMDRQCNQGGSVAK
jgi:hypothetical protein